MTATTEPEQWQVALESANRIRSAIAQWRATTQQLPTSEGIQRVIDLVGDDDPGDLGAMRLDHALLAIRKLGMRKVNRVLRDAFPFVQLSWEKRIRDLTPAQRRRLCGALRRCTHA